MKDIIDDSMCDRIAQADDRTWTSFYEAMAPVLRSYAVRTGSDEPEDVVQEVFVKFVVTIRKGKFRAEKAEDITAYMKTLVRHRVIDDHRKAQARCRDMTVELDEFAVPMPSDTHYVIEAREAAEISRRSRQRAMADWKCSDRTKEIFVACTSGGHSVADVAKAYGVPQGTVRQIRHRGMEKMKSCAERAA